MKTSSERRRSIEWHIRHDDYFGTLATVLDLMWQDMEKAGGKRAHREVLRHAWDDLMYLQDKCRIHRRIVA